MIDFGLQRCGVVFYRHNQTCMLLLIVYVDDIMITDNGFGGIQELQLFLQDKFHTKDLG